MESGNELEIRLEGMVVRQRLGLEERREREVSDLMERREDDESYEDAGDYDPVLIWHCRLEGKPPVL